MRSSASTAAREHDDAMPLRAAAQIALAVLLLLTIGAAVYYRLRIFSDTAYIAFSVVNGGHLNIISHRYGAALTQWVPLLGAKLGLPLKAILIGYSTSFHAVYFAVGCLLFYRFRNYALVLLLAFYHTLVVSGTYFFPTSEMHQGVAILFVALAVQQYSGTDAALPVWRRAAWMLLCAGLTFVAVFSHPLVVLPFLFLLGFFLLLDKKFRSAGAILQVLLVIGFSLLRIRVSAGITYDNGQLNRVFGTSLTDIGKTFTNDFADRFWKAILSDYWLLALVFIASMAAFIRSRRYVMAVYVLLANVGFFVLSSLVFYEIGFHVETELMPFGILGAVGFVYLVLPRFRRLRLQLALIAAMFLVRVIYILAAAPYFEKRYQMVQQVVREMRATGQQKAALLCDESGIESIAVMYWGMPYESLLWSSTDGDKPSRTFLGISTGRYRHLAADTMRHTIICPWGVMPADTLNSRYFQLDTSRPYATWDCDRAQEVLKRRPAGDGR